LQTNGISPTISPTTNQTAIYLVKQAATILKANIMKGTNFTNYNLTRENLGFSISTMLVSCYFNGIQCYSTDFYLYETFDYGNCYTFNGLKNSDGSDASVKQTTKSGPNSGLILELFTGVGGSQDYYTIKSGVFVLVHNNSVKPLVQYDGVNVQTGTSTNIRVSRTFSSKLDLPYSNCRADLTVLESDSVYYKLTSKFTEYKQKLCFDYYKQINIAIANCNCNDPSLPLVLEKNSNICSNTISLNCIEGFKGNTSFSISNNDCPMECDSIDYSLNIDSAVYPSSYYASILRTLSFIKSKFVVSNTFSPRTGTSFLGPGGGGGGAAGFGPRLLTGSSSASTSSMSSVSSSLAGSSSTSFTTTSTSTKSSTSSTTISTASTVTPTTTSSASSSSTKPSTLTSTLPASTLSASKSTTKSGSTSTSRSGSQSAGSLSTSSGSVLTASAFGLSSGSVLTASASLSSARSGSTSPGSASGSQSSGFVTQASGSVSQSSGSGLPSSGSGTQSSSQTITLSDIQSCFVMVSVFYENLEYTMSEESPAFDFNTLLGVIGKKLLDRFSK
jgi:hypothetical protein